MGRLLFVIFLFTVFSFNSYSQENNWTEKHLEILNKYSLEKNDHRGIVFIFQEGITCDKEYSTIVEAIEEYLSSQSKKDLSSFCISNDQEFIQYNGQPLDLFQIISLFLQFTKK